MTTMPPPSGGGSIHSTCGTSELDEPGLKGHFPQQSGRYPGCGARPGGRSISGGRGRRRYRRTGGDPSFRLGCRMTGHLPGWRRGVGPGAAGGLPRMIDSASRCRMRISTSSLEKSNPSSGPVGHQLVQPAFGLVTVSQAMMGQGQEGKPLGVAPIATGLNALVQTADGLLEPAGAVQCRPEGLEHIAPLSPSFRMPGQSGLGQTHRGLVVGDRVGGQHTGPGDAVGLRGIGRVAEPS